MRRTLIIALLLSGCNLQPHELPYCRTYWGDPSPIHGERQVMCVCESGATIPQECGGGVAPTDGVYGTE